MSNSTIRRGGLLKLPACRVDRALAKRRPAQNAALVRQPPLDRIEAEREHWWRRFAPRLRCVRRFGRVERWAIVVHRRRRRRQCKYFHFALSIRCHRADRSFAQTRRSYSRHIDERRLVDGERRWPWLWQLSGKLCGAAHRRSSSNRRLAVKVNSLARGRGRRPTITTHCKTTDRRELRAFSSFTYALETQYPLTNQLDNF